MWLSCTLALRHPGPDVTFWIPHRITGIPGLSLPRAKRHGASCYPPISSDARDDVPPRLAGDIAFLSPKVSAEKSPMQPNVGEGTTPLRVSVAGHLSSSHDFGTVD